MRAGAQRVVEQADHALTQCRLYHDERRLAAAKQREGGVAFTAQAAPCGVQGTSAAASDPAAEVASAAISGWAAR